MKQIAPLLRRLLSLLRPQRARLSMMVVLVSLDAAYGAVSAWSLRLLIDRAVIPQNLSLLLALLGALALGLVLASAATLVLERVSARLAATAGGDLRRRLFAQLQALPMAALERLRRGDLVARFSGDVGLFETVLSGVVPGAIRALASLLLGLLLLASLHPLLLLLAVVLLPLCILGAQLFGRGAALAAHRRRDAEGQIATAVAESLASAVIVRSYGLADRLAERFAHKVDSSVKTAVDAAFRAGLAHRSSGLGILLAELAGLALASWAAIGGHISIGELVAFQALLLLVCQGLLSLTQLYPAALDGAASLARIDQLLRQAPEAPDHAQGANVPALRNAISFEQVEFAYDPARPVLRKLNLCVAAGEWLSLVGPSGAGKSSLLHLLMRFADPDAGHIRWDGIDLATCGRAALRRRIGYVPQDSVLFDASLADNIALFDPDCDPAAIREAARLAGVEAFARNLPMGLDTPVGENGSALSGGQRQRVAIARALLRRPDVLLLDEPTSALDAETEADLLVTLRTLAGRHTLLLVTHRPAPALAADRVVHVAQGRVLDEGVGP